MTHLELLRTLTYKPGYEITVVPTAFQPDGWLTVGIAFDAIDATNPTARRLVNVVKAFHAPPTVPADVLLAQIEAFFCEIECHEVHEWLRVEGKLLHALPPHG